MPDDTTDTSMPEGTKAAVEKVNAATAEDGNKTREAVGEVKAAIVADGNVTRSVLDIEAQVIGASLERTVLGEGDNIQNAIHDRANQLTDQIIHTGVDTGRFVNKKAGQITAKVTDQGEHTRKVVRQAEGNIRDDVSALRFDIRHKANQAMVTVAIVGAVIGSLDYAGRTLHLPPPPDGNLDTSVLTNIDTDGSYIGVQGKDRIVVPTKYTTDIPAGNPDGTTDFQIGDWGNRPEGFIPVKTAEGETLKVSFTREGLRNYVTRMDEPEGQLIFSPSGEGVENGLRPFTLGVGTRIRGIELVAPDGSPLGGFIPVGEPQQWQAGMNELQRQAAIPPEQPEFARMSDEHSIANAILAQRAAGNGGHSKS